MTKESEIQKAITSALSKMPDIAFYTVVTSGKVKRHNFIITIGKVFSKELPTHDGMSDILAVKTDGTFIALEVKSKPGKATEQQLAFIKMVNKNGGRAGVVRSVKESEQIIRSFEINI